MTSCLLAACPGPEPGGPDAPGPDVLPGSQGLGIVIQTDRPLPATLDLLGVRVEEVRLFATSVRAIGDAAPGDDRTTRNEVELRWKQSDTPDPIYFDRAPAGRYSTVEIRIAQFDGDSDAFRIRGDVEIAGDFEPFEIEAEDGVIAVSVPVDVTLAPGGVEQIDVTLSVAALVDGVDWASAPVESGIRTIGDGDPQMPEIRSSLEAAFTAGGGGGG